MRDFPLLAAFSFFCILFLFSRDNYAQLNWKLSTEGGLFLSDSPGSLKESGFLTNLDGQMKYNHEWENSGLLLELRGRPEIYGLEDQLRSLKLKGMVNYYLGKDDLSWGINVTALRHAYNFGSMYITYNNLSGRMELSKAFSDDYSVNLTAGYIYKNTDNNYDLNENTIFWESSLDKYFTGELNSSVGFYAENFKSVNKYPLFWFLREYKNSGYRLGPVVRANYSGSLIIKAEYRYLFHYSEVTKNPSNEHLIRFLAGTMLGSELSVFLLADYYFRRLTPAESIMEADELNLYYSPVDYENRIYIKLVRDLSDRLELFIKSGYSKENIINYGTRSFASWNFVLGFEYSN